MLDASTIWDAVVAGALLSSSEAVKLGTKQAYDALKVEVSKIWGPQASSAIDRVEADPSSSDAKEALQDAIPAVPSESTLLLADRLETLGNQIDNDLAAREKLKQAQVVFDIDIKKNALIGEIQNADSVNIKAKAESFESKKISMNIRKSSGKF